MSKLFMLAIRLILANQSYAQHEYRIIISTGTPEGFKTTGYSLNIDYLPISNAVVRLKGKLFDSKDNMFIREARMVSQNAAVTTSIAFSF